MTIQIFDETVLHREAKHVLLALGVEGMTMMYLARKLCRDGDEILTKFTEAVSEALTERFELCRWALTSAGIEEKEREATIARGARAIAAIALGMLDKVAAGEAVDSSHADALSRIGALSPQKTTVN